MIGRTLRQYFVTEKRAPRAGHEFQFGVVTAAADRPVKAAGEWNQSRLVVSGRFVEQWLNGKVVRTYEVPASEKLAGHLMLTCQGAEGAFRDIKLRELK